MQKLLGNDDLISRSALLRKIDSWRLNNPYSKKETRDLYEVWEMACFELAALIREADRAEETIKTWLTLESTWDTHENRCKKATYEYIKFLETIIQIHELRCEKMEEPDGHPER